MIPETIHHFSQAELELFHPEDILKMDMEDYKRGLSNESTARLPD